MTHFRQFAFKRIIAAAMAAALMLQPLTIYAVPSPIVPNLSQVPLQGADPVKPNLMFTLDDSGSMASEFVPDYVGYYTSTSTPVIIHNEYFCLNQFSDIGVNGRLCGMTRGVWDANTGAPNPVPDVMDPPVRSSNFNKLYYNPTVEYAVGVTELRTPLNYETPATAGTWTHVYADAYQGYVSPPGTFTPGTQVNLTTTYPDTIWCWKSAPTVLEKATADLPAGTGAVCRRNGYAYAGGGVAPNVTGPVAAGYNYPNRNTGLGCQNVVGFFDCPFAATAGVAPYYYTISKVQFCDAKETDGSLSPLNVGFGKGTCSPGPTEDPTLPSRWDLVTYQYVRYGTDANNAFEPSAFTRVDIKPTFLVNGVAAGTTSPAGRTYAQEMTNFAKWYAFYRTRMTAMKTAAGLGFSVLDDTNSRVGYHTIRNVGFKNVLPFSAVNKSAWFNALYDATPSGGTPLPQAMWRIGQLFSNPNTGAWTNVPATGLSSPQDPLDPNTGACQNNYHLLATDGYWNVTLTAAQAATVGDLDNTVPGPVPPLPGPIKSAFADTTVDPPGPNPTFVSGQHFPNGYYQGPVASVNNLSDLAMKYWINDIRKDFPKPAFPNQEVPGDFHWQHLTFYGLSIGAEGTIRYTGKGDAADLKSIIKGDTNWPPSPPNPPNIVGTVVQNAGAEAIDDLWHAAVIGRGAFISARDPQELARGIAKVISDTTNQAGTATGIALKGGQLGVNNKYGYKTSFNDIEPKDWSGDVRKYELDPATGAIARDVNNNLKLVWSARGQLDAQAAVVDTVKGWDTDRRIATMNGTTPVAFRYANLSPAQQSSLNIGWTGILPLPLQQDVLNFLRGDHSKEGIENNSLRQRTHVLGDIVGSAAVPVGPPSLPYEDATNPGYSAFKSAQAGRSPMVYVGANDGMLHAFIDPVDITDATGGREAWAYVPGVLFSGGDPNDTAHTASSDFQVGALAYQAGGIPLFKHKSYVNATPRVWDIDFANTGTATPPTSGNDWRTILVGGLGVGGRAVYALDVTNPAAATEADAVGKVLWEFTETNLGYVYDAPTLVKTKAKGWVALIASGYNNPGGKGFLYVLNPNTGAQIAKISLPNDTGTDAAPTGLSTVRAFVATRKDPYTNHAYGGDLKGNVWRFDLSEPDPTKIAANWKAEKIALLKDKNNAVQPITAPIRIEIDQTNDKRYVFVGTGKLLSQSDVTASTIWNTIYVIHDGTTTAPEAKPGTPYAAPFPRPAFSAVCVAGALCPVDPTCTTGPCINGTLTRGWYQDATTATQNIVTEPEPDLQAVVFAFTKPASDPCAASLSATLFAREFTTGNSVLHAQGDATLLASADIVQGIAGINLVQNAATPSSVSAQITDMSGAVFGYGINIPSVGSPTSKHRVSWRLINN